MDLEIVLSILAFVAFVVVVIIDPWSDWDSDTEVQAETRGFRETIAFLDNVTDTPPFPGVYRTQLNRKAYCRGMGRASHAINMQESLL